MTVLSDLSEIYPLLFVLAIVAVVGGLFWRASRRDPDTSSMLVEKEDLQLRLDTCEGQFMALADFIREHQELDPNLAGVLMDDLEAYARIRRAEAVRPTRRSLR